MSSVWKERALLRTTMRRFFEERGYLEVDTPIAVRCPGVEVHLQFFETIWENAQQEKQRLWLRTSPEIHLKKALASGHTKLFEIGKCFRNRGEYSDWHHPEFTMLEWYCVNSHLTNLMDDTEGLLHQCYQAFGTQLKTPIKRLRVRDIFAEATGVDLHEGDEDFAAKLQRIGCQSIAKNDDFETAFYKAMFDKVESHLARLGTVFLYDYPRCTAALASIKDNVAQRFECYINGIELCNGFQELLGREANALRIAEVNEARAKLYGSRIDIDEDFLAAMDRLSQPVSGNALGFDRLLACIRGDNSVNASIPFR